MSGYSSRIRAYHKLSLLGARMADQKKSNDKVSLYYNYLNAYTGLKLIIQEHQHKEITLNTFNFKI